MYKKIVKLLILVPLLLIVIQCSDDDDNDVSTLVFNRHKINITSQPVLSLNDTIWINGKVSAKAYDKAINDSVFSTANRGNFFSIYRFIEPTEFYDYNTEGAISQFLLFFDVGEYSFSSSCENTLMTARTELDASGSLYRYRLGLKPTITGNYFISWRNSNLQDVYRNYQGGLIGGSIRIEKCRDFNWVEIEDSGKEYFFRVE